MYLFTFRATRVSILLLYCGISGTQISIPCFSSCTMEKSMFTRLELVLKSINICFVKVFFNGEFYCVHKFFSLHWVFNEQWTKFAWTILMQALYLKILLKIRAIFGYVRVIVWINFFVHGVLSRHVLYNVQFKLYMNTVDASFVPVGPVELLPQGRGVPQDPRTHRQRGVRHTTTGRYSKCCGYGLWLCWTSVSGSGFWFSN